MMLLLSLWAEIMIEFTRGKWDTLFSRLVYKYFTKPLCNLTGKSSTVLSRKTYFVGVVIVQAHYLREMALAKGTPYMHMFLFLWFLHIFRNIWRTLLRVAEIEQKIDTDNATVQITMNDLKLLKSLSWDRSFWFGFSIILFVFEMFFLHVSLFLIGIFICSLAMYAATHFKSGGKSVYARIKEKISNWATNLKPAPALVPAPVRYDASDSSDHLRGHPLAGDGV